ncbi:hypothetical protein RHMOL_Rhmol03G0091000 [Rhododendron molle]|uniref:Uncharacterized protein n=1 Tax=Rhododendron molle TaxID=49168 RepID=A0ACC0PDR0_RHOML|nr:hypothetical protein RHMOL_Rhmol03G0091000 [Rhododendron molle]
MAARNPTSLKLKTAVVHENSRNRDVEEAGNDDFVLALEKLKLVSRKKLIVLDLNGLLVHRVYRFDRNFNVQDYPPPDVICGPHLVFTRPFCSEFLEFCFERFEVGIWSSARERSIDTILNTIKTGLKDKLLFVWDQEKCTDSGFKSLERKDKPIYLKELKKLWEDPALPWRPNGELRLYLDGLAEAADVPSYVKEHRIGQATITQSDPNWDYYSKIVRRCRRW